MFPESGKGNSDITDYVKKVFLQYLLFANPTNLSQKNNSWNNYESNDQYAKDKRPTQSH